MPTLALEPPAPATKVMGGRKPVTVIPNRLREHREATGISVREIARLTGINRSSLSDAERQQIDLGDADKITLARYFSEALGRAVSVTDLFFAA